MRIFSGRVLPAIAAVLLMLLLEPWNLQWWMIDVGVGLLLFAFAVIRDPGKPELRDVWIGFAVAIVVWGAGWLVARFNGLSLEELVQDQSVSKHLRRIPDYAVVFATFAVLHSAWLVVPSSLREQSNGT